MRGAGIPTASLLRPPSQKQRQQEAVQAHAVAPRAASKTVELLPGPPVRWRSAHRWCRSSGCKSNAKSSGRGPTCSRRRCACERRLSSLFSGRCQQAIKQLRISPCIEQTRAMKSVPSSATTGAEQLAATGTAIALVHANAPAPNPSIERTSQSPLRALCAAAHVKR